jgi:RNA polymerase sigma-70 factor (sigma-E family)
MTGRASAAEREFTAFAVSRAQALARTAYLLTGDHHRAEDLVQTTLFKTAKAWGRIKGEPEAYARRVMYHEQVSWWRRRSNKEVAREIIPERTYVGADIDTRLLLVEALSRLTPKQRAVLVLRFFDDLSEAQTAAALGIAPGTVKSQTRHALRRLRLLAPELAQLVGEATS